ncbi:hypothetical protein JZU48_04365, partial [bacterium]|nr:hypothetical protein [bacterium]
MLIIRALGEFPSLQATDELGGTMPYGQFDSPEIDEIGALDDYQGALAGMSRREFLAYCTGIAATLGLEPGMGVKIANAAVGNAAARRPSVIWLSGQACTGCTETLLRTNHP